MSRTVKKKIFVLAFVLLNILNTTIALAEEAGHSGNDQITFMGDWLPRLVNFIIIVGCLIYAGWKFPLVQDFFKNRTLDIAKAMQESKDARERAVFDLAEMGKKIKELEAEMNRMIAEAQARGEKDRTNLEEEGKRMVQNIQNQVMQGIEMEVRKAKSALATEVSLLSVDLAEDRIKKNICDKDQKRIVKEYITNVGGKR